MSPRSKTNQTGSTSVQCVASPRLNFGAIFPQKDMLCPISQNGRFLFVFVQLFWLSMRLTKLFSLISGLPKCLFLHTVQNFSYLNEFMYFCLVSLTAQLSLLSKGNFEVILKCQCNRA